MKTKLPPCPTTSDELFRKGAASIEALTSVGCSGMVLGFMIDMTLQAHGRPKMPAELGRYVCGPVIVHNKGEDIHDHPVKTQPAFRGQIHWERAQIGLGLSPFMVSPTEIAMVMYEASLVHPFRDKVAEIYLWAGSHAVKSAAGGSPDTYWEMLNGGKNTPPGHRDATITDAMVLTQEPWKSELLELSREIRRKVVGHQKSRDRAHYAAPEEGSLLAAE